MNRSYFWTILKTPTNNQNYNKNEFGNGPGNFKRIQRNQRMP